MGTTTKTLIFILISLVAVYVFFTFVPLLARILRRKIAIHFMQSSSEHDDLVNSFLKDARPGKFFVALLGFGLLRSIKTINHGLDFPDDKQTETFKLFGESKIAQALDEIGDGI